MHLDRQHPVPVYLQLKKMLQNQIEQGVYFAHQKLPSERDLCQLYNLSRMTARRALKQLIAEGFAYTRIGKGTFVSDVATKTSANRIDRSYPLNSGDDIARTHYLRKLVEQLLTFDCVGVERTICEALATHPLEMVAVKWFPQVIRQLEERWHNAEIDALAQNYAVTTLRSQLTAMLNAASTDGAGSKALLACAPGDQHEIGLLLLALSLRRRGFVVVYLGPGITTSGFQQVVETVRPQLICFSAATTESAKALATLSRQFQEATRDNPGDQQRALITFGGVAFNQNPALISRVSGLYLGDTVEAAVLKIQELFSVDTGVRI